ncbi:Calx-beta domain-containing protein [Prosthecobacter sp.]|uniref:Calx-beta domain-containing protein n=1 Tax=Prosthecobacter sp. TaxID=1965333 RepID=UPI0037845354
MRFRAFLIPFAALFVAAVFYVFFVHEPAGPEGGASRGRGLRGRPAAGGVDLSATAEGVARTAAAEAAPADLDEKVRMKIKALGEMAAFTEWSQSYLKADDAQKAKLLAEGVKLAEARRPVMKALIKADPRKALTDAVPMVVRQKLPPEVLQQLEQRLNQRMAVTVYQGTPPPGSPPLAPGETLTHRIAQSESDGAFNLYVYGRRDQIVINTPNAAINGVRLDREIAANESPLRVLEVGEVPDASKAQVTVCPISGITSAAEDQTSQAVTEAQADTVVETPEEVVHLCGGYHRDAYSQQLVYGEGATGGPTSISGPLPAAPTPALGQLKVLYIPLTFQDTNAVPSTEAASYQVMRDVSNYYLQSSYGKLTTLTTVTPPIKLPKNEAWYVQRDTSNGGDVDGLGLEMTHAREEARRIGFDYNDYDVTVVRLNGGARPTGGWGGGSNVWVYADSVGICAHEIGHSFGLAHANYWDTSGTSAIGPGTNAEYGDVYDVMGSGGVPIDQYNVSAKNQIKWLPDNFVQNITTSGLYRLYAFDQPSLDPKNRYALTITKDSTRVYWGELRQQYTGNATRPWVDQGMLLGWKFPAGASGSLQLIDTTPGSPYGKDDAPIALGQTFADTESGIYMTTVNVSSTTPKYIDVQVNLGDFSSNTEPTLTLASSADSIPLGGTVTFTATAADVDGDTLAYQWQHWGDTSVRIVSPNSAVISRTFPTAGAYVVSCTVSDMKGGSITREKMVMVGAYTTKFTISGRVTSGGVGLPGVLLNANGTNPVITDQDGYYTITNLAANTYAVTPLLYGYTFSELFNNAITVGPNYSGANFTADTLPTVALSVVDGTATENSGAADTAKFRLTRTGDTSLSLDVSVATAVGTASTGDYTLSPALAAGSPFSTFTIPAGSATLDVVLTTVNDSTAEGPETMTLVLASGSGYLVASNTAAGTITIVDDDTTLPQVGVVAYPSAINENGTPGAFTFTRTGATTNPLNVVFTISGSAVNGTDYSAISSPVTIPAGASSATLTVTPVDNTTIESMETVTVTIPTAAGYVLTSGQTTATINILDDDTPTVNVTATDSIAAEVDLSQSGAIADTGTFVVTRTGDTSQSLTLYYSVAGNQGSGVPALNGVDYEALSGVVVIPAGATQASITIIPRWDNLGEGTEQVVLQLGAGPTNYLVGSSASAAVTITDASANTPDIELENISSAAEPSTSGTFRLTIRGGTGAPLVVRYTMAGTALNGTDYDNPATWNAESSGVSTALYGVWAASTSSQWAVGDAGVILQGNGSVWAAQTSGVATPLRAVWGADASNVWAVGDGGVILKWNGTLWSAQTSGTTQNLRGVWGANSTNVWAVGDSGTILKWNGTVWAAQTSGISTTLNALWGTAANSVWAVGDGGVVRFHNGTTWAAQTSNTSQALRGVWGSSATSVWAVGTGGTILKFGGSTWAAQTSSSTQDLNAVWAADANNLWAVGTNGTMLRATNGSNWSAQISNAASALYGVRGTDANNVWAAGAGGAIVNNTAVAGQPFSGTLVVPSNTTTYDLTVRPINDGVAEDIETVILSITPDAAYQTFSATSSASMWLRDSSNPTVWADAQINTGGSVVNRITENSATSPRKYYISRTGATTAALAVNFQMLGSATAGTDYSIVTSATLTFDNATSTGVLTIPAGSAGADVAFNLIDDLAFEGTETMIFHTTDGAYSKTADALIYIDDNETSSQTVQFGTAGVGSSGAAGAEGVTTVNVPVTLTTAAAGPVSVDYIVDSGSRSSTSGTLSTLSPPYWVRVVRSGTALSSYYSMDGTAWTQVGTTQTVSFAANNYTAGIWAASNSSGTSCVATIDNVSVTGLDAGVTPGALTSVTVGTSNPTSSSTGPDANGVYTITAGGTDLSQSSTTDICRYLEFPITGSVGCTVTARVVSITGGVNTSKGGVMIRETTANTSKHMAMAAEKTGSARTVYRSGTTGANAAVTVQRPYWVRLTRAGTSFSGHISTDGSTWQQVGSTQTLPLSSKVQAGLAVSARSDGTLETAVFDNVSISTVASPSLVGRTIGFVNAQGSDALSGGVYTVIGSGAQIGGTEDECHFVAMPVTGDFTLVARVLSQSGGAANAQAGVMIRESNTYRCRSVYMGLVENALGEFISRSSTVTTAFGDGIDYTLPSGSVTFAAGERDKNIVLAINQDSLPETDETLVLVLRDPNGASLGTASTYTYTIMDDDTPPQVPSVGFAASTSSVAENAGTAGILVSLSAVSAASASVDYSVTGGTATSGTDYVLASGTVTFAPGELVKSIPIALTDDSSIEGSETVVLSLANAIGANVGTVTVHTLTITDDDSPVVSISATDANASEAGLDPGTFTVTRTGPTTASLTVTLARTGTATSGTDFTAIATPLSLTIPIGASSATVTVSPLQDTTVEGPETVIETISANAGYIVGTPSTATVTIADDDRSTVNLVANDDTATETPGNTGQFTLTRTAPSTAALTVNYTIAGTATNTTDYATLATSVSFAANETSKTITVTPVDDAVTEGDETVVLSITTNASYDIGAGAFATVTIKDNDSPPVVYITSPAGNAPLVSSGQGLMVGASVTDDGLPQAVTMQWTQASGPGTATFATPTQGSSAVTFSADGVYVLKITATDTQFTVSDQVTVIVGSVVNAADYIAEDMSPTTQQRGASWKVGTSYILTGMGAGYASTGTDGAHIMARQVAGDGSVVARLTSLGGAAATPLAGVTIRDSFARSSNRAVLGYSAGALQFRTRTTLSASDTVVTQSSVTLPVWVKLDRTGSVITASYAPDVSGSPGSYTVIGTATTITMADANTQMGLTATGNSSTAGQLCTATFDNLTLTPTPTGPAVLTEDFGTTTPTASTFGYNSSTGTYSIGGSGSIDGQGAFYGWQYYGDLMVTAKLATASSSALSAISGIELRESMDSTAGYIHIGRKPSTAFGGFQWRTLASGGTGSVPAFNNTVRWIRLVRQGNRVTGYHAADNSGSPGAWTQLGQPQTIIMPAAVLVGFGVDNSGGTAGVLNNCTFTNLSIVPLNKAPVVAFASMATWPLSPVSLPGTVTDDNFPAPVSLTSLWSKVSGPGTVSFTSPTAPTTTATLGQAGAYVLRLTATDSSAQTFRDLSFTGYTRQFEIWQAQNWIANGFADPNAAPDYDADRDGQANLLEYAFGTAPLAVNRFPVVYDTATVSTDKYLRMTVPKNAAATDVTFTVEATSDLSDPLGWSSAGLVIEQNTATQLIVRDSQPMTSSAKRYMRVKVVRN